MNTDPLFSDDVEILRREIVRLRTLCDQDFRISELYRVQCEHLKSIIELLINNNYGNVK